MVSQSLKDGDQGEIRLMVSIPVRGSGKSKKYNSFGGAELANVSIPVRGSGKSKL